MNTEFVTNINSCAWQNVFEKYSTVLESRANQLKGNKKKDLLELDKWYQEDLSCIMKSRSETYITSEEICQLMTWKLTRGKFRPRLQQMVATNSDSEVKEASLKAFKCLPDLSAAVQALTVLKAIGPATASAILAAGSSDVPFMADESVLALPGSTSLEYNLKAYLAYAKEIQKITSKLLKQDKGFDWTSHKVEITLWTYYLGKKLLPNFLKENDEIKEPVAKKKKS